jgi:hypothetical protein
MFPCLIATVIKSSILFTHDTVRIVCTVSLPWAFRLAQAIFRAKPFPYKYPTFSTPVTLHTYPPMKMEQTQCSEMLALKLQTPVNHPEESIHQSPSLPSMVCYRVALNFVMHSVENKSSIYRSDPNILNRSHTSYLLACEDGTDTVFWNVGI